MYIDTEKNLQIYDEEVEKQGVEMRMPYSYLCGKKMWLFKREKAGWGGRDTYF